MRTGVQLTDILILRERLRIQIPFKLGNEQAPVHREDVDGGADHIEHTVDASDQANASSEMLIWVKTRLTMIRPAPGTPAVPIEARSP